LEFGQGHFIARIANLCRDQTMAAKIKKAVFGPHLTDTQKILPEADQGPFDIGLRLGIVGVKIGAGKKPDPRPWRSLPQQFGASGQAGRATRR
jgi:hypothetical protein